jgi:hypothetical protein
VSDHITISTVKHGGGMLDFRTLRSNVQQSVLECSLPKTIARSRGRSVVQSVV